VKKYNLTIKNLILECEVNQVDTKLLLKHILQLDAAKLIMCYDYELSQAEYERFTSLLNRLKKGEPIHYIIGEREFFSRNFKVNQHTLIPRSDTEILVEETLKHAKNNALVLELGTGSGCIAITCSLERPDLQVWATEKYINTLKVAKENNLNLKGKVNFIQSDWFSNFTLDNKFDVIISNPPYIASKDLHLDNLKFEPYYALTDGEDGFKHLAHIIKNSVNYLKQGAYLLIEHGYNQALKVQELFRVNGFKGVTTIKDYGSKDRVTLGYL
jgi:release factor glutamine methyltransferase